MFNAVTPSSRVFAAALAASFLVFAGPQDARAQNCALIPGDLTADGIVNIVDLQCAVLIAQAELLMSICPIPVYPMPACLVAEFPGPHTPATPPGPSILTADMNCDGEINIQDVQLIALALFSVPPSPAIPPDEGCPNFCLSEECGDGICSPEETVSNPVCALDCPVDPEMPETEPPDPVFCCSEGTLSDCGGGCLDALPPECNLESPGTPANNPPFTPAQCAALAQEVCSECAPVLSCCDYVEGVPFAGCNDSACEACVCASDPLCCDVSWDVLCVQSASSTALVGAAPCNEICACEPWSGKQAIPCVLECNGFDCVGTECIPKTGQAAKEPVAQLGQCIEGSGCYSDEGADSKCTEESCQEQLKDAAAAPAFETDADLGTP